MKTPKDYGFTQTVTRNRWTSPQWTIHTEIRGDEMIVIFAEMANKKYQEYQGDRNVVSWMRTKKIPIKK